MLIPNQKKIYIANNYFPEQKGTLKGRLVLEILKKNMENAQCLNCQHYDEHRQNGHYCSAFPKGKGIPQSIWENKVIHDSHVPGQNGDYTYTPKEQQRKTG